MTAVAPVPERDHNAHHAARSPSWVVLWWRHLIRALAQPHRH